MKQVKAGDCTLSFDYSKRPDELKFEVTRTSGKGCTVDISPALSLRTQMLGAEWDGHRIPFQIESNTQDQHATVHLTLSDQSTAPAALIFHLSHDFGLTYNSALPSLGSSNSGMRIVSESWNDRRDTLILDAAFASAGTYDVSLWNPGEIAHVDGADLVSIDATHASLRLNVAPHDHGPYPHQQVTLHFNTAKRKAATYAP